MFLLPLQPLPGAPSIQSPESSGLLDIGTGFRDMLQNAQQQLDADGAPISPMPERPMPERPMPERPMPERPMLAALMADLLNGAASGGEDTPKQIVSVLVSDAPVFEGTSNISSGPVLPVPTVAPTVFEGEGILPEDVDAFVQMGQPVARKQGSPDIIANDTLPTTLPISESLDVLPELQLHQTSQPISSDETGEMDQAFSEQAPRDLTPMQHAGVVQVQPPITAKPVFDIPEQPVSQPTEAHTPVVHVPLTQVETDVAVSPSHQVEPSNAPESGILPQQQLETANLQNTQMPQMSASSENVFQPIIQAVVSESMDNDQTVLPRHPLDVVNAQAPQAPLTSESLVSNVPQASIISTSIGVPAASPMTEEAQTMGATRPIFAQQVQTVQREVVPDTIERETPVITQPKQAAVQDAIVTQQMVVSEDRTLRSAERPVQDVSTSSVSAENRLFVASEGQMNEDTGREQRDSSRQTFVAPTAAPEQAASTTFEEVGGPDAPVLNIEQNVNLESQAIERIPGRPEMRVDMMPRAVSTSDVAQGALEAMPSEQIDRNYQVSEQVIRNARVMMRGGATQVTMRLDPQELGEVTIRLSTQDQVVSGEILVENQKVQEIVQRNLGTLRDALAGQGIQLGNIDVSVNDRGAQADREAFRESLQERSGEREQREQARSDSQRWEQNERQQKQTPDGQVDFMA
jgi:flagellar hook-length control protein FliK